MLLRNKYFISTLIIVFIIASSLIIKYFLQKDNSYEVINSKLGIDLPPSLEIEKFSYDKKEGCFDAKMLITNHTVDQVEKQLNRFFGGIATKKVTKDLPDFGNSCPWWDLKKQDIEVYYKRFVDEKRWFTLKSHEVWAFISKDGEGQNYLYISY